MITSRDLPPCETDPAYARTEPDELTRDLTNLMHRAFSGSVGRTRCARVAKSIAEIVREVATDETTPSTPETLLALAAKLDGVPPGESPWGRMAEVRTALRTLAQGDAPPEPLVVGETVHDADDLESRVSDHVELRTTVGELAVRDGSGWWVTGYIGRRASDGLSFPVEITRVGDQS